MGTPDPDAAAEYAGIGEVADDTPDAGVVPHLTRPCPIPELIQIGGDPLGSVALMHILVKDNPHHSGLGLVDNQLINLMLSLVEAATFYEIVAVGSKPAFETAVLDKLAEGGFCADRSLFAFTVSLPEADIVGEFVGVGIKTLLTLLGTPYPDAVLDKPFHHKGRFVSDTPDAVKHEHQQNIELALLGPFFDDLEFVAVFGPYLVAGYAVLLFLVNNRPAHLFTEAVALSALHGDVGLAFIVIVHLLVGGHSIQTVNASSDKNVIFHIDPSFHLS